MVQQSFSDVWRGAALVLRGALLFVHFQQRIVLQGLLNFLLQVDGAELQEANGLLQLRCHGELLAELEVKCLFHGASTPATSRNAAARGRVWIAARSADCVASGTPGSLPIDPSRAEFRAVLTGAQSLGAFIANHLLPITYCQR